MSEVMHEERLEAANAVHEQREYSRSLDRHRDAVFDCRQCGRIEDPGQTFEDDLCPACTDRMLEDEAQIPASTLETLTRWFVKCDRAKGGVLVPMEELKAAIIDATGKEDCTGQYPWESGGEYDIRRMAGNVLR